MFTFAYVFTESRPQRKSYLICICLYLNKSPAKVVLDIGFDFTYIRPQRKLFKQDSIIEATHPSKDPSTKANSPKHNPSTKAIHQSKIPKPKQCCTTIPAIFRCTCGITTVAYIQLRI